MTDISQTSPRPDDDEIDLMALLGTLWDGRWLILILTLLFTAAGVAYALLATPVYRASSMIQVEEKGGSLPGMEGLGDLLGSSSTAATEIQLIKSRAVLGPVVDKLHLDIVVQPNYFPLIGKTIARRFTGSEGELAEPLFGESYAWGGERLDISRMEVPDAAYGRAYTLEATEKGWHLYSSDGDLVLKGVVGELAESGDYALMVQALTARPGTTFSISKRRRYSAISELQSSIGASEQGKDSGIITLSYEHENYRLAEQVLDEVGNNYVRQNVERNSAEAAKSLEFLRAKLPEVKQELEQAEQRLNEFQIRAETIDISAEGQAILDQVVELEKQISQLEFQRAEIEQRFRPTHPRYKAWLSQMEELKQRRRELDNRIGGLPETQQELVRLRRDVEVGNEIYLQMLSNIQQLDIARAGTVGNVRIVDSAAVDVEHPVKPKKALIVALAFLLGGFTGVAVVAVRALLNRGIENPEQIEAAGLPVYASIPLSEVQEKQLDVRRRKKHSPKHATNLLAVEHPADLAVEALRSLRTSLHFAMMDAPNNILMISGPSPAVGKSFVATNLAAVMALADQKVLLIDADMRKGLCHEIMNTSKENGLSEVLSGQCSLEDAIRSSDIAGQVSFMPRGTLPPNPSELLMSPRFDELLRELAPRYDLIIIDTPPVLAVTDAAIVGRHAGTTMLVVRFGRNPLKEVELTRQRFEQNGVELKGAIFNGVVKKASAYGQYGYYNYEYKSSEA